MENLIIQISGYLQEALATKIHNFLLLSPYILGAVAVFALGLILAEIASFLIIKTADTFKLEIISDKLGFKRFLKRIRSKLSPSEVIAKGVKGYIAFLFFIEATKIVQLNQVADFLTGVVNYIPDVIVALFIIMVGFEFGTTMEVITQSSLSFAKSRAANMMGIAVKGIVVAFAILAALAQLRIAETLVQILFIGFVAMMVLAGGLAFGLGGKDVVRELLEAIKRK